MCVWYVIRGQDRRGCAIVHAVAAIIEAQDNLW